jgi:siroheme synthase-like protein
VTAPLIASLDMAGRDCLVVGGGRRALRTVRHALAHGARVTTVAPRLHPELRARLSEGAIAHHATTFSPAQLRGMAMAFADTGDPVIDKAVCLAAAVRGIAVHRFDADPQAREDGKDDHVRAA